MDKKSIIIIGVNLAILTIYSTTNIHNGLDGRISQLTYMLFHAIICFVLALWIEKKASNAYWVSFFLILLIGFGVCTQIPFMLDKH